MFCAMVAILLTLGGCGSSSPEPDYEKMGLRWLDLARISMRDGDYALARDMIDSLRTRCALALNAREAGIILLDSINLKEARQQLREAEYVAGQTGLDYLARDSVDTRLDRARVKVKFYERKLQHDIANRKQH